MTGSSQPAPLTKGPSIASIESVTLEVPDPTAAERFYTAAFGLGPQLGLRASEAPRTGFRGFTLPVARSFARTYVEFAAPSSHIKLALYKRRALAKDAGVSPDGTGSHRIAICSDAGPFTDPDGFAWEAVGVRDGRHTAVAPPAYAIPQAT